MSDLQNLPWEKLLRVSSTELDNWLVLTKETPVRENLKIRFYSLKATKEGVDETGFITYLLNTIENYVFEKNEILEKKEDGEDPLTSALKYFGDVDPIRDGRYGDLILYLLTEGVLKVPLVVHKISQSYSANKQVEGSDGIFIGNLNDKLSLLLGESKMRNVFNVCLSSAIDSVDRFHQNEDAFKHEISVARKHLSRDLDNLSQEALKNLYSALRPSKAELKQFELSHPILLVYKEKEFANIQDDIEKKITAFILKNSEKKERSIHDSSTHYESKIILNFFLLPVKDVNAFRTALYKAFHNGKEYVKKSNE